jgi:hypothetical protein
MKDFPFTVYDFFAYLASGFVVLLISTYAFDIDVLPRTDASSVVLLAWVVAAYITGHVIAHLAGVMIEDAIVRRRIGRTEVALFSSQLGWRRRLFAGSLAPLPAETIERVVRRADMAPGTALFFTAWAVVKRDAIAFSRMNTFLNLYGFARNIAMACGVACSALAAGALLPFLHGGAPDGRKQLLILPLSGIALVMFYRYLKFLRLYAVELYVTYAADVV